MTLEEMKTDYRQAKDKKAQIPIIADQALMTPWEVSVLLHDAGEDVDMRWYAQKKNWQRKEPAEKKEEPEPEPKDEHTKLVQVAKAIVKAAPIIAKECGVNQEALTAVAILLLAATEKGERA